MPLDVLDLGRRERWERSVREAAEGTSAPGEGSQPIQECVVVCGGTAGGIGHGRHCRARPGQVSGAGGEPRAGLANSGRQVPRSGLRSVSGRQEYGERPGRPAQHDGGMDDQAFEWVTLFSYENLPGCPRPDRLILV
ncbi:hypothetical protein [Kitasatospora sp. NPDC048407]|uniref:hypothetical protein n=1 Tax=Kitasatospora sp. NPDC048407 TaxID=3364051 RepID=UPI0037101FF1